MKRTFFFLFLGMLVCACGESEPETLSQEIRIAKKDAHYVKGVLRVDEKRVETDEIVFNDIESATRPGGKDLVR